jgi:hypothetical protein
MQQKKLALGEAITKTYHYDSYPLSIIAAYGNEYMPWIFSNYIQLNANKNLLEKQEVFLEFYGSQGSQGFYCPYLNIQKILWSSFVNLGIDIDTYIKKHIDQDYYMYFQVDEFYVPNRVSYGKLHVVTSCNE